MTIRPCDCIFFQLAATSRSATRFFASYAAKYDVTPAQSLVLLFLADEDRITSRRLGEKTSLDSATLTGILDRLESMELVERRKNPDDRRAILACLTKKGRSLCVKLEKVVEQANKKYLGGLTGGEEKTFRRLLGKVGP